MSNNNSAPGTWELTIPPNLFLTQYAVKWLGQDVLIKLTDHDTKNAGSIREMICHVTRRYCEHDLAWSIETPHRLMDRP